MLVEEATEGVLLVDNIIGAIITPPPSPKLPAINPTKIDSNENLKIVFPVH